MNPRLKRIVKTVAEGITYVGCLLAAIVLLGVLAGDTGRVSFVVRPFHGAVAAAVILFWALLIGGVLRWLLNIDDRLQRLEETR